MSIRKIIPRSTWGAGKPRKTPSKVSWSRNIQVWVHNTEYPTLGIGETAANEYKRMREIQNLHFGSKPAGRGWDDIGYHYVIMPSGRIYEGRGKGVIGSHCPGQNSKPGIAFDGKFNSEIPSKEALESFAWLLDHLNLGKNNLKGHRDGFDTSCPGNALYNYLIRDKKLGTWERGTPSDDDSGRDTSGYTFPSGIASAAVTRIVPTPVDDPFSADLIANKNKYYNTLNPEFKNKINKYLPADAYFSGGYYDVSNMCSFHYKRGEETKSIYLIVPPNNISWTYSLRTKVEDTYGGQVIQILGVQIDNFKLRGYIPNGFWGQQWKEKWDERLGKNVKYLDNNYYDSSDGIPYFEDKENVFLILELAGI